MFFLCGIILLGGIEEEYGPVLHLVSETTNGKEQSRQEEKANQVLFPHFSVEASVRDKMIKEPDPLQNKAYNPPPFLYNKDFSPAIRGVYVTGWSAGSANKLPKILKVIDETYLNAIVIDIKDDEGTISYISEVPLAVQIGAGTKKIRDIDKLMAQLQKENIYPIARVVAFKDPFLAKKKPELAVKSKKGGLWQDRLGLNWVDPYNKDVWQYIVDISKEAASKGFKEIQFDYVRFTSDGVLADCIYPYADGRKKHEVIRDFLRFAYAQLKPYNVVVSADIFGLVLSVPDDLGIGQQLEEIAQEVDLICPMVYPSHYYPKTFGIDNPNAKPYETILRSMTDAKNRISGYKAKIRPWLQDFTLGKPFYGKEQLEAQVRALKDAGIHEWLWWNPSNNYDQFRHSFSDPELLSTTGTGNTAGVAKSAESAPASPH